MAGIEPMVRAQPLKYNNCLFNADKTEGSLKKSNLIFILDRNCGQELFNCTEPSKAQMEWREKIRSVPGLHQ